MARSASTDQRSPPGAIAQQSSTTVQFSPLEPRPLSPEEHQAQLNLLDDIMDDIGMGKFQKQLLVLCGLGWFADNMWLQCIASILPRVQDQFEVPDQYIGILSSSVFVGMMFGAMFWGMLADSYGRKQAFNFTLIVTTVFGVSSSFANSYWLLCLMLLGLGFGVGGNMPVDGALFLEFTPKKDQYLLTFLSIFFSFGAVASSILGYILLPPFSCEAPVEGGCQGKGWRYMLLAMGGMTFSMAVGRVILFRLEESPKFLLNQNRHEEAALVLGRIFKINHNEPRSDVFEENLETLTTRFHQPTFLQQGHDNNFYAGDSSSDSDSGEPFSNRPLGESRPSGGSGGRESGYRRPISLELRNRLEATLPRRRSQFLQKYRMRCQRKFEKALQRLQPLMAPRFRTSTLLIWAIWALVAFAYTAFNVFYPKFLQEHGQGGKQSLEVVYRDIMIYAAAGVPGSVIATAMIETRLGRRYTMALSTFGTALSTILFALVTNHTALTVFSAILSLLSTLNYAVLYSYTPEVFPSEIRGTACGVAAAMSRLAGILSPLIVGAMLSISTSFALYTAFAVFLASGICMCFLPIETRGRAAE